MEKKRLREFNLNAVFKKKRKKLIEDLFECIEIINVSSLICNDRKCFINVIALQLRIMFCDGKNSLVTKLWKDISFHPLKNQYFDLEGTYQHDDEDLFDKSKEKIPLEHWLRQKLIYNDKYAIDIRNAIKLIADKSGAHMDEKQPISLMLLKGHNNLGIKYLINIGIYVIKELLNLMEKEHYYGQSYKDKC